MEEKIVALEVMAAMRRKVENIVAFFASRDRNNNSSKSFCHATYTSSDTLFD